MAGRKFGFHPLLPFLAALLLVFLSSGCGQATDTSGLSGEWVLAAVESDEITLPDSIVSEYVLTLRLDPGGNGRISGDQTEGRVTWSYEEGRLELRTGSIALSGTVEDGSIFLRTSDEKTMLRFVHRAEQTVEDTLSMSIGAEQKSETIADAFAGDWYGWWKIEDSVGEMPVSWYDCCASFVIQDDSTMRMIVWDEDGSREAPLAEIVFVSSPDDELVSLNGYFDLMEIRQGDLRLESPNPDILISGIRHDSEGETYQATVYLRPWGDRWIGAPEEQRPFYYEDWYLPLLNRGSPMPDEIPWESLEERRAQP